MADYTPYKVGTIAVAIGETAVVGTGAMIWATAVTDGDELWVPGAGQDAPYTITINSDTSITLDRPYTEAGGSGLSYRIDRTSPYRAADTFVSKQLSDLLDAMGGMVDKTTKAITITSAAALALAVGLNGAINPQFAVKTSIVNAANGVRVTGNAAGAGADIDVISSTTNDALRINAKGAGTITIGDISTGAITLARAVTITGTLTAASIANTSIQSSGSGSAIGGAYLSATVADQAAGARSLIVAGSSSSTTIAGSSANLVITNADTTTNNTAQLSFAALTGASAAHYASATISGVFGARTNGQYPTGQLVFSTSSSLNNAPTEKWRINAAGDLIGLAPTISSSTTTGAIRTAGGIGALLDVRSGGAMYSVGGYYIGSVNAMNVLSTHYLRLMDTDGVQVVSFGNATGGGSTTYIDNQIVFRKRNAGATTAQIYTSGGVYVGASPSDPGANNLTVQGTIASPKHYVTSNGAAELAITDTTGYGFYLSTASSLVFFNWTNGTPGGAGYVSTLGWYRSDGVTISKTTPSTNTTSGALVVTGGAGIGGSVYIGGALDARGGVFTLGDRGDGFGSAMVFLASTGANKPRYDLYMVQSTGEFRFFQVTNAANAVVNLTRAAFGSAGGLTINDGSGNVPTGGDKGSGTINAAGSIYVNNSALTCYGMEYLVDGKITLEKWDRHTVSGKNELAHYYADMVKDFDPRDHKQYIARMFKDRALPGMPLEAEWVKGNMAIDGLVNRLWLSQEVFASAFVGHVDDTDVRIKGLTVELSAAKARIASLEARA